MTNEPAGVTVADHPARPRRVAQPRPRAAGRRRRPRPAHHHSAHAEDRPRALGLRRVPARRPRARLRRERGPLPRDPRPRRARSTSCSRVFSHALPCLLVTGGFDAAAEAARRSRPRAACRCCGPAPRRRRRCRGCRASSTPISPARGIVHGVLMDILGLGVLIVGESGIGKSECALDLVVRGHRLVADDAVELRCRAESFVIGTCPELTRHHMEIRGLGTDQRPGSVRRRLDAVVEAGRARRAAGTLGARPGVRSARPRRRVLRDCSASRIPMIRMPVAPGPQRRDPGRGRGAQPAAARARASRRAPARRARSTASSSSRGDASRAGRSMTAERTC